MSVRALFSRYFVPHSLQRQGVSLQGLKPLYERKPPLLGRWTYSLVVAEMLVSICSAELVWDHWTEVEDIDPPPESGPTQQYVLQPWYKRAPVALAFFGLGTTVGLLLLADRHRTVRKLFVLPPTQISKNANKHSILKHSKLVVQSAADFSSHGRVYPLGSITLERSKLDTELLLKVDGVKGDYNLTLQGAQVNGEEQPEYNIRAAIFNAVYGDKGPKMLSKQEWKIGSVRG